jgi:SAM-dependent methyltransferase
VSDFDADAFDAYEAEGWGAKDVSAYDALAGRVTSRVAEPLLDAAAVREGTRLLDVASGPGYVARAAVRRAADVVGVDLSDAMLAFAASRVEGARFVRGDAMALPFADGSFDAVTAAFVLLHLSTPERAAAEAARVLAPGGAAALTVWDAPERGRWLGVLLDAVAEAGAEPPADVPPGPPLFRFADDGEFEALLSGSGLEDVTVEAIDFTLWIESRAELWDGLVEGTVRIGPLVRAQPDEVRREIRARFDALLDDHRAGEGYEVPVAVKLASGRKP